MTTITPSPARNPGSKVATIKCGAVAPDFPAVDASGKEVRLSNYTNQVIVLDFWATWCGPCMESMPHVQEVAKRYRDKGLVVLATCVSDTRSNFLKFLKANQTKYPDIIFTCDPNERGSATFNERASGKLYGISGIPTQIVIGRDRKVKAVVEGYDPKDDPLKEALTKLGFKP